MVWVGEGISVCSEMVKPDGDLHVHDGSRPVGVSEHTPGIADTAWTPGAPNNAPDAINAAKKVDCTLVRMMDSFSVDEG